MPTPSSNGVSSTGSDRSSAARDGNSKAESISANSLASSPSTIPLEIDWSNLSPRGMAIVRLVATSASLGWTAVEIGKGLGMPSSWVVSRLDELRTELEHLNE